LIGGVTLGIGIGIGALAGGGALAMGLAALLAICVAITIGGGFTGNGAMFINQTSVSAILVIALPIPGGGSQRLIEALVGGGVAVVISVLLFPAAPLPLLREAAQRGFVALHAALQHLDDLVAERVTVDPAWMLRAGEHIYQQLGELMAARFTAEEIVRLAPRWWRVRPTVRGAEHRLGHLNLLANSVLSLLRTTVGGLGVEPALPAQLRAAIHQLTVAFGALAENPDTRASDALADAAGAARLASEASCEPGTHALLISSIVRDCARDLYLVVGTESE
jgi:uncharacterized membrane protein YgaE (UPF0421/DUF939 family)